MQDIDNIIYAAYGAILGRIPDDSGYKDYSRRIKSGELSIESFLKALIESDEFQSRKFTSDSQAFELPNKVKLELSDQVNVQTKQFLTHKPFSLSNLEECVPPLNGEEYFEYHKARFLEMVNAIHFFKSHSSGKIHLLEVGSIFTTKIIKNLMPEIIISTIDMIESNKVGIENYYLVNEITEKHYVINLNNDDLDVAMSEKAESFDIILLCEVLEHLLINPVKLFRSLLGLLKPGGYFYVTTPNLFKYENIKVFMRGRNPLPWVEESFSLREMSLPHIREFGMCELIEALKLAGGNIYAIEYSDCWDNIEKKGEIPWHCLGNLVVVCRKK
jgi:hypothetical protein